MAGQSEHLPENEELATPILRHLCGVGWGSKGRKRLLEPGWGRAFPQLLQNEIGGADGI
jgi:hypothetical protein